MKIVTVAQMRQIEKEAFECGITYDQMMMTAGTGIAEKVIQTVHSGRKTICGIIGAGNNGGDTLIALTVLAGQGWQVTAWLVSKISDENQKLLKKFQKAGGKSASYLSDQEFVQLDQWISESDILLDGAIGIGCHLPLRSDFSDVFSHIRSIPGLPFVVAVDCPSGMDCDSGAVDTNCLPADMTICIEAVKIGEVLNPACHYVGTLALVPLNLPGNLAVYSGIKRSVLDLSRVKLLMPARKPEGHKGTFGTVSVFGGSEGYIGAPVLTGIAAYRTGCGLVKMFTPPIVRDMASGNFLEAIWIPIDVSNQKEIEKSVQCFIETNHRNGAIVIGPGFGLNEGTSLFIKKLLDKLENITSYFQNSMVIDADGLSLLAEYPNWFKQITENCVLTPHPGEMARLTGYSVSEIQAKRIEVAEKYAGAWRKTIVLKGAYTVVAAPDGRSAILPLSSSALAKAGSGDILAGIIASFLAQRDMDPFDAACLGVWVHGTAGLKAQARLGNPYSTMATDILNSIPKSINSLL